MKRRGFLKLLAILPAAAYGLAKISPKEEQVMVIESIDNDHAVIVYSTCENEILMRKQFYDNGPFAQHLFRECAIHGESRIKITYEKP